MKKIEVSIERVPFEIQYEITHDVDGWFDLIIWYKGKSMQERVPSYSANRDLDIKETHAPALLESLIAQLEK